MFGRTRNKYVVLQEDMPVREQRAMERAVVTVLSPVEPSRMFVHQLAYDLVEEAKHKDDDRQQIYATRILGLIGGGLLSIVGGLVVWILVRSRERSEAEASSSSLSGETFSSTSSA